MRSCEAKGFRPWLEVLEGRWVPAMVHDVAGLLLISNPNGPLVVTVTSSPGTVVVQDNSGAAGYTGVGTLISIIGTNGSDSITFHGGSGFGGNVLISSGNGNDAIAFTGPDLGYLTIVSGVGTDSTSLNGTIGSTFTYHHTTGGNSVTIAGATTIGGDASLSGLGNLAISGALKVGGNLAIGGNPTSGMPLSVAGAGNLSVRKGLYVTGGTGLNTFASSGVLQVKGNTQFNFYGPGGGGLYLANVAAGSFLGGSLYYSGGSNGDTLQLGGNLTVAGDANLFLGSGPSAFTSKPGDAISGSLSITTGNGSNTFLISGTVDGNETLKVGNGTVNLTLNTAPAGLLTFQGGNGNDTLNLGADGVTQVFNVYLSFGTGTSTLNLVTADTVTGNIVGKGFNDSLNQNDAILLDVYLQDFPSVDF